MEEMYIGILKIPSSFCCPEIWQGSFVYCIHLSRRFHCLCAGASAVYQPADRLPSCHCHRYGTGRPGSFKPASQRPKRRDPFFSICRKILFQGFLIGAATMWAWEMGYSQGGEAIASTMAFSTLTLARLFHGFNCRGRKSLLSLGIGSNLWCVMALFVGVVLMCAVLFVPQLQDVFAAGDLTGSQLLAVVLGALAPTAVIQIYKIMSAGTA